MTIVRMCSALPSSYLELAQEAEHMWNSKPKRRGHSCRKKVHGRPKISSGVCYIFHQAPAIVERRKTKKIVADALSDYEEGRWTRIAKESSST